MATNRKENIISSTDFDGIKSNLKDFLRSQDEFADYDFEASGLNILLDILAYNTHYNSMYLNMAINEMFLDSAQRRNSIVSLAKHLAYVPRSISAAKAIVNITAEPSASPPENRVVLRRGTRLNASIDGTSYVFSTNESYQAVLDSGQYYFEGVELFEGIARSFQYVAGPTQRYVIEDDNVDINTLTVTLRDTPVSEDFDVYTLADEFPSIDADTKSYWVEENEDGKYEIKFGDGVVGYTPEENRILRVEYIVTHGDAGNNATSFDYDDNINVDFEPIAGGIEVVVPSTGGGVREDKDSVRFLAPLWYQTQNRLVTSQDYEVFVLKNYPVVDSVSVWGGEENDPPFWGVVFISLDASNQNIITETLKEEILEAVNEKSPLAIVPRIVDPDYIDTILSVVIYYDQSETTLSQADTIEKVENVIDEYGATTSRFGETFYNSVLTKQIIDAGDEIVGARVETELRSELEVRLGVSDSYSVLYNNPIESGSLRTTEFRVAQTNLNVTIPDFDTTYLKMDDVDGKLRLYYESGGTKVIVNDDIGTIDYTTGKIEITELYFTAIQDSTLYFYVTPANHVVETVRNKIIRTDSNNATLNLVSVADE